jgi:hypothetical protein
MYYPVTPLNYLPSVPWAGVPFRRPFEFTLSPNLTPQPSPMNFPLTSPRLGRESVCAAGAPSEEQELVLIPAPKRLRTVFRPEVPPAAPSLTLVLDPIYVSSNSPSGTMLDPIVVPDFSPIC